MHYLQPPPLFRQKFALKSTSFGSTQLIQLKKGGKIQVFPGSTYLSEFEGIYLQKHKIIHSKNHYKIVQNKIDLMKIGKKFADEMIHPSSSTTRQLLVDHVTIFLHDLGG